MSKTTPTILIRDTHRHEYQRTMTRIVRGSIVLWIILAIYLGNNIGGGAIVPMSIIMIIGLAVVRFVMWREVVRDLVEL